MKKFLMVLFFLCVTVYFNDGSRHCFKDAKDYTTDGGDFRTATEYWILDRHKTLVSGYEIIARIPMSNVRIITKECK